MWDKVVSRAWNQRYHQPCREMAADRSNWFFVARPTFDTPATSHAGLKKHTGRRSCRLRLVKHRPLNCAGYQLWVKNNEFCDVEFSKYSYEFVYAYAFITYLPGFETEISRRCSRTRGETSRNTFCLVFPRLSASKRPTTCSRMCFLHPPPLAPDTVELKARRKPRFGVYFRTRGQYTYIRGP